MYSFSAFVRFSRKCALRLLKVFLPGKLTVFRSGYCNEIGFTASSASIHLLKNYRIEQVKVGVSPEYVPSTDTTATECPSDAEIVECERLPALPTSTLTTFLLTDQKLHLCWSAGSTCCPIPSVSTTTLTDGSESTASTSSRTCSSDTSLDDNCR